MKVSQCIKSIRIKLGLNQTEFAKLLGMDKTSVSLYESGKRQPGFPTIRKIVSIAKENGMGINYEDLTE